jgi:aspartate aminotransferase
VKTDARRSRNKVRASKLYQPDVNLNLNVRGLGQSATLEINERSDELARAGHPIFRMGLGQSPFPVPRSVVDELKANAHQKAYLPVKGLRLLRDSVAAYVRRTQGIEYSGEDVLIGPGSKELMFILQLVYYGDLVIPTPSWVSYAPQAHIIGRHIQWLNTEIENDWRLTAQEIETMCRRDPGRPRLIVVNYPNNPTGVSYSVDQLRELAAIARKYRVVLLSDEIYGELDHNGRHVSIAKFYPEGTVISTGLSKWCGAGGWRLGTFIFPRSLRWLMDSMAVVASETFTSTSSPIQYAAVRAFDGGIEIEEYLAQSRRILKSLGARIARRLKEAGVMTPDPEGAFYLFPSFEAFRQNLESRGVRDSMGLCNLLLEETGVAALPGSVFGRQAHELTARLAFVDFDGGRALTAARRTPLRGELDNEFLDYYCATPIQAIERICRWVQEAGH